MDHPVEKPMGSPARQTGPPPDPDPEYGPPTEDATTYVYLQTGEDRPGKNTNRSIGKRTRMMRLLGPLTVRLGIRVPAAASEHMLSAFEDIALGGTWAGTVTGTLFGGAAAHLPPAGTLTAVVLEILAPPVLFCVRRRRKGKQSDGA